jgi:hypothetical protein
MSDDVTLGPTRSEEPCAQGGDERDDMKARAECRRFIPLLRETFGPEPSGTYLQAKAFPHDFGAYWEGVCHFNPDGPHSIAYALRLERESPTTWGSDGTAHERGPGCGGELELGSAVQLFSFTPGGGFRCRAGKVICGHDLTGLARPMGYR